MTTDRSSRLVPVLATSVFLQWAGGAAVVPLLPVYLASRGSGGSLVGVVMGAFFAVGVLVQLGVGRLGDRVGHRSLVLAGLVVYGLAGFGYLLDDGTVTLTVLRGLQGGAAGAVEVCALALVAQAVPQQRRGRAYSLVYGSQMIGVSIGPALGALGGVQHMSWLFAVSAVASLASAAALLLLAPATRPHASADDPAVPTAGRDVRPATWRRLRAAMLVVAVAFGSVAGLYEATWSLLLLDRGASDAQIALSWTLYGLPFVALAPLAGRLADTADRRVMLVVGLVAGIGIVFVYPWLTSVTALIVVGVLDALAMSLALPSALSLLSQTAAPGRTGAVQSQFTALNTSAIALATMVTGALFEIDLHVAFLATGCFALVVGLAVPPLLRGAPGLATAVVVPVAPADPAAPAIVRPRTGAPSDRTV